MASSVTGKVLLWPWHTMPKESPTKMHFHAGQIGQGGKGGVIGGEHGDFFAFAVHLHQAVQGHGRALGVGGSAGVERSWRIVLKKIS
jgi:hypothetical protein